MSVLNLELLNGKITELAKAERITKKNLSELSRELLQYQLDTGDVSAINRLLGEDEGRFVLTPINWRITVQYFAHFIGHASNYQDEVQAYAVKCEGERTPLVFGKKSKRHYAAKKELTVAWLEDEANDIWLWSSDVKMDAKPVDYKGRITKAIVSAMDEDKGGLSLHDVLGAVMEADIDITAIIEEMNRAVEHVDNQQDIEQAAA